jgi:hypothetical protein
MKRSRRRSSFIFLRKLAGGRKKNRRKSLRVAGFLARLSTAYSQTSPPLSGAIRRHSGAFTAAKARNPSHARAKARKDETMKPRMTPQEAGRLGGLKGGRSKSRAKLDAARHNGFKKVDESKPAPEIAIAPVPEKAVRFRPVLIGDGSK